MKVKSLSRVRLFATPWPVAYQTPPFMGFSRQECWSGLPLPSPGDSPDPGIKPGSPALHADDLPSDKRLGCLNILQLQIMLLWTLGCMYLFEFLLLFFVHVYIPRNRIAGLHGSCRTSPVAQMVKRLPTMQETQVRSLGWEGPLEKEMATHSSTLVWKIPWMEERSLVGYSPWGHKESDMTERLHLVLVLVLY